MRIIFFGTPDFAVASLEALMEAQFQVVAVVTAPDKPAGRGQQIQASPVKLYAEKHQLPILQPIKLKDPEFLEELKSYQADLQVIVAFRMLPEAVWNMPPLGTFNLHASLLPNYRGAAPIHWAVINGEEETGVTTFFLQHEIDTGDLLFQEKEPIYPTDTTGDLYERLMKKGAKLVVKTAQAIQDKNVHPSPQVLTGDMKPAPKLHRATGEVHWSKPGKEIINLVRGMHPFPGSHTTFQGKNCKLIRVEFHPEVIPDLGIGVWDSDQKTYLRVGCADGYIQILEWQMEGKKRMPIAEFLRGYSFIL
ncbi:methionyl-tRNA formyltransferase [Aquirufa rosea]|uniref:Methionyl-tRNA formyltransferase n=1 Tax=Aquirufa rosea TaxID=2509241 RepID=A0A4Q1C157_9BACT|nr:methionyl-tRNA formyltransferase [Aquirufa rosea]RXK50879.1 methionyl-tRNA formyltransferase [Aquirufa rosea]